MKLKSISLMAVSLTWSLLGLAAMAETTQTSVSKKFSIYDVKAKAETTYQVRQEPLKDGKTQVTLRIVVVCSDIDAKIWGNSIAISESMTVDSNKRKKTKDPLTLQSELIFAADTKNTVASVTQQVSDVLTANPVAHGTGLNMNTPFANLIERMMPGSKDTFLQGMTDMVYTDRINEMSEHIAKIILGEPAPQALP